MKTSKISGPCAYCGASSEGTFAIHRDGLGLGPEVPLCNGCGGLEEPTCERIWARISKTHGAACLAKEDFSLLEAAIYWQDEKGIEGVCPSKPGDDPRLRKMTRREMMTFVTDAGRDVSGVRDGDVPIYAITAYGRLVLEEHGAQARTTTP